MTFVDSNVIIDVLTRDPDWHAWSEAALAEAADRDDIVINPISMPRSHPGSCRSVNSTVIRAPTGSAGWHFPTRLAASLAELSWNTAGGAASGRHRCQFLYCGACRCFGAQPADPRCPPLCRLLPEGAADNAGLIQEMSARAAWQARCGIAPSAPQATGAPHGRRRSIALLHHCRTA